MRILSITAQKPDSTGSGVYMTELIKNWQKQGHEQAAVAGVYIEDKVQFPEGVCFYPVYFHSDVLPFSIAGMSDEMPYASTRYRDFDEIMLGQFSMAFRNVVDKAVREFAPDVIICHHLYLLCALVREWYPDRLVFAVSHGSDLRQISKNDMKREFIKSKICLLDGIFALQETHREEIVRIFGVDEDKIKIAGVGYNQEIFWAGMEEKQEDEYTIAYAGKISKKKGVESLLRAVAKMPYPPERVTLKLAGGAGNEIEYGKIRSIAQNQTYRTEFLGALSQDSLAELFRKSHVFVLPSFFEGLALVNLEAMACGCQVVSSNTPGMKEWYDSHVPGHEITFVELPRMKNTDDPYPEDLPEFEEEIARAITEKLENRTARKVDLEKCSWRAVAEYIVEEIQKKREKACL